jgi:DNA sulfur modification protein DndC
MYSIVDHEKIRKTKEQIKDVYLSDSRPWVVGYSGGKDSTVVVQLVFEALSELRKEQLHKRVYVISSDTGVETPLIISSIEKTLQLIQIKAHELGLPIECHKVQPEKDNSFWAFLIGKGYPPPRQKFRWCTDRLKIDPANRFILDKVSEYGEVVMVLGVRDNESSTRDQVLRAHTFEGKILMRHSTLPNAYVYAPIRNFTIDDVWDYLLDEAYPSPWGGNNHDLRDLYDSSNSECPLMVDKEIKESAGSCGNSRFGCWVCTVVKKDKALIGFIESGHEWLEPLLIFRNNLAQYREIREYRQKQRMKGQVYLTHVNKEDLGDDISKYDIVPESELGNYLAENKIDLSIVEELNLLVVDGRGNYKQLGLGPFTLKAREMILRELLETQRKVQELKNDPEFELITIEELKAIRRFWRSDGDFEDRIPKLYKELIGKEVVWEIDDHPVLNEEQATLLRSLCDEMNVSESLMKKLIRTEQSYYSLKLRKGILQEIEQTLNQDWLHL